MATTFLASRKSTGWRIATVSVAVIAVAVGLWGYQKMEQVNQLTADLQNSQSQLRLTANDLKNSQAKLQLTANNLRDLQSQLQLTTNNLTNSQSQLQVVQSDLQNSNVKLQAAAKPDLPVVLRFRKAFLHAGLIAVLKNISPKTLEVVVDIQDPTAHQHKSGSLVIDASRAREIGYAQGWEFAPGQHITLSNPKYRPIDAIVTGR